MNLLRGEIAFPFSVDKGRSSRLFSFYRFLPELEPTVIACLAGRDSQEVLYTGFVQTPSGDSKRSLFLPDI